MKKNLISILSLVFCASLFAQHYEKPETVLTPEQIALTQKAAPKRLAVEPKKVRKFLVWSNTEGARHFEGIAAFNALLKELEKVSAGQWKFTFGDDPEKYFSSVEKLQEFDCIVLNNTTGRFFESFKDVKEKMTPEELQADKAKNFKYRDNLLEYVKQGGGVMGVHAATDAMNVKDPKNPEEKSPAYPNMIGGVFAGHPWNGSNAAVTVIVSDTESPLTKGIWPEGEFKMQDEIYTFKEDDEKTGVTYGFDRNKQRVLLDLDFDRSPKDGNENPMKHTSKKNTDFGLAWIKKYGKGRVFYGAFGDRIYAYWQNPKVCEFYMRGLQYASGDLQADATPLGMKGFDDAMARALLSSFLSLRNIEYGDKIDVAEKVFFKCYKAITESKENASKIEKLCVKELKENSGTKRYQKLCSELLQVTGANSTATEVGEIIVRDSSAKDIHNRYYTESLFIALARSTDSRADNVLKYLADSKIDYISADAIAAIGFRKNPENVDFLNSKFLKTSDPKIAYAAVGALAKINTPESYAKLVKAYDLAKTDTVKNLVGEFCIINAKINKEMSDKFIAKILADKSTEKNLLTLCAIEQVKLGKYAPVGNLKDVIAFLSVNKDIKIPTEISLEKLPEDCKAQMIYALVKRDEGKELVTNFTPTNTENAAAFTYAVAAWGLDGQIEKAFKLAHFYSEKQAHHNAFVLSGINCKNSLEKFVSVFESLDEKSKDFAAKVLSYTDVSDSYELLIAKIKDDKLDDNSKKVFIKTLNNTALKNEEVFIKLADLYNKLPDSLSKDIMAFLVSSSRRGCTENMVNAAQRLMLSAKSQTAAKQFFRFASANMGEAGAKMLMTAYQNGMKDDALKELLKWTNTSALKVLKDYDLSLKDKKEREKIQKIFVTILQNANALDSEYTDYIVKNAVDKNLSSIVLKMKRLNLGGHEITKLANGISVTTFANEKEAGKMFDYNSDSKWASKQPTKAGDWVQIAFDDERIVNGMHIDLGNSKNDGLLAPKIFGGISIEDFDEIEFSFEHIDGVDFVKFKKPQKLKMLRIEQGEARGNWWTIGEIIFDYDTAIYTQALNKYSNGIIAGASHGNDGVKNALDGNIDTRWSTNCKRFPGQWFILGFEKPRKIQSIALLLKSSGGDRVMKPRVFAGASLESMQVVNPKYSKQMDKDLFTFENPIEAKFIRIENGETSGNFWSFHEIEIK